MSSADVFLPGVAVEHVLARLDVAGGNEVASGKLAHPESSAALAVNAFGWFIDRPSLLPPLLGTENAGPACCVEVEYCARFPWSGGRHPWLDAAVFTDTHLIGVESKRHEPSATPRPCRSRRPTIARCGATTWRASAPSATLCDRENSRSRISMPRSF